MTDRKVNRMAQKLFFESLRLKFPVEVNAFGEASEVDEVIGYHLDFEAELYPSPSFDEVMQTIEVNTNDNSDNDNDPVNDLPTCLCQKSFLYIL